MAIVIEEEKRKGSLVPVLIWTVIVGTVIAAVYFLAFNQPPFIQLPTPLVLENTNALANIQFDPQQVTQSPVFQALQHYVPIGTSPSSSASYGRQNPFLPY